MKKKIIGNILRVALAAIMLSSLAACGSDGGETTPVGDIGSSETQQNDANHQTTQDNTPTVATIEETVMLDNDDIKVTALSLTQDQYYHILNLQIENKTSSDLYVMASRTAVNSFVTNPNMGMDVPANGSAKGELKFWLKDVEAGYIADIETRFSYSNSNRTINRSTERVKLETSAAAAHDYSYDESGTILYDAKGIKIICQGFNDEGNPIIYLSSTGELSEGCCVEEYEIYINGKKSSTSYSEWVFTNTRNIAELELRDKDVDGNELGEVESIKISFKINKENVADSRPVKTELVEIPVK